MQVRRAEPATDNAEAYSDDLSHGGDFDSTNIPEEQIASNFLN